MTEKRKVNRREFMVRGAGAAAVAGALGYAGYKTLGSLLNGFFGSVEETARDFRVTYKFNRGDNKYLEERLVDLPFESREVYARNSSDKSEIYQGSWDYIEALQRQSLKVPTVESKPVEGLRDAKKRILKWTKGLFSKEKKEESRIQAEPEYTGNYNDLARLRMSTMERVEEIEEKMRELSYKLTGSFKNSGVVDRRGLAVLDELIGEQDKYISLLRNFKGLSPAQILRGENDESYKSVIQRADEYGIKPYVPNGFLSRNAGLGVAAAAGVIGAWVGNKLGRAVYTAGSAAGKGARVAGKGVKKIADRIKVKKGSDNDEGKK